MGLSGSSACVKYLLFIFNLIFVITGITILSVGGVVQAAYNKYEPILDDRFFTVPALLIATGAIILIISFFGCCGAVKENHCMILTFSALLMLIFILELSAGITGYVLKNSAVDLLETKMNSSMNNFMKSNETAIFWNGIQEEFGCCGTKNYSDWDTVFTNGNLPGSCCEKNPQASHTFCNTTIIYPETPGCIQAMGIFATDHAFVLGGVGIGIAVVQFLGIMLACSLAHSIRKNYETV